MIPDPGYFIIDVTTNGALVGRTNSVGLANLGQDVEIKARFGSMLMVSSDHGSPELPVGVHYAWGDTALEVPDSTISTGGIQYVCEGWTGAGSVPASGAGPDAGSPSISNDSSIVWQWTTNFWLKVTSGYGGQVVCEQGWKSKGSNVTICALSDPFFAFSGWSGADVADSNATVTTVSMDDVVCLTANFHAELSPMGVPAGWFASQGLTNGLPSEVETNDIDGDGLDAWEEFFAGTTEGDGDSVFRLIALGRDNGSNFVKWLGGTNGSALPFCLLASTNLADGWYAVGDIPRSMEGTNCWWGPIETNGVFYRVVVKTGL